MKFCLGLSVFVYLMGDKNIHIYWLFFFFKFKITLMVFDPYWSKQK